MVCDNCFINHIPEDCIIDGHISDYSFSSASLISLSDAEDTEDDVISISEIEPEEEAPASVSEAENKQQDPSPTPAPDGDEAPLAITLQQVMMTAPARNGFVAPHIAPVEPNASQPVVLHIVPPPVSVSAVVIPSAPPAPAPVRMHPNNFSLFENAPPGFQTLGIGPSGLSRTTRTQLIITEDALCLLSTPLQGTDLTTQTMEAFRQANMTAHLQLQRSAAEAAA